MRALAYFAPFICVPLLGGCHSISGMEADLLFEAANDVMPSVYVDLASGLATQRDKDSLAVDWAEVSEGEGYTFSGTLTGTMAWTGTILADGQVTWSDTTFDWDLSLEYLDVLTDGITMNGVFATSIDADAPDDGTYSFIYNAEGDITATGDVQGEGYMAFTAEASYDGSFCVLSASGDVDGYESLYSFTLPCGGF